MGDDAATETSAPVEGAHQDTDRTSRARWRIRLGLVLVVLAVVGPFVSEWSAQAGARFGLTAAIIDEGTIRIDTYREGTVPIDRVETDDGRLFSDKAPGQPFLAAPVYAVGRLLGAEPASVIRIDGNLGLWWVTLWSSVLPAAAMVVLMYEAARRHYPTAAVPAALSLWAGTMWLVLSSELYGHALSTSLAFGAWVLVADHAPSVRRAALAGLLVGLAVATEYPLGIIAVLLGGYFVVKRATRPLLAYVLGGVPGALFLLTYQWAAFGSPFQSSYDEKAWEGASGLTIGWPDPGHLLQIFVGSKGLVLQAIVLVGLVGCVRMLRNHEPAREHAIVGLVVFGAFLVLQSGSGSPWGGEVPGPRYLMTAVPWLAVPLASMWKPYRTLCLACAVVGAGFMSLPLIASHLVPEDAQFAAWYSHRLRTEGTDPTIFTLGLGPFGWLVHLACIGAAGWYLARSVDADSRTGP